jgi:hypothetical protein
MEDVDNNQQNAQIVVTPGLRGFITGTTKRLSIENPNSQCGWKPRRLHEMCEERLQSGR